MEKKIGGAWRHRGPRSEIPRILHMFFWFDFARVCFRGFMFFLLVFFGSCFFQQRGSSVAPFSIRKIGFESVGGHFQVINFVFLFFSVNI